MTKNHNFRSKSHSFTEEQIRAKAHEIWQSRNRQPGSEEEDWNQAITELETERSFIKKNQWQAYRGSEKFWNWTGFKEKKLWDLLQLLVVPIVLASVGFGLQEFAKERERSEQDRIDKRERTQQEAAKERERTQQEAAKQREQELADEKAKQEILIKYLDQMAILLQQGLLNSTVGSEIFVIAQSKTVTALQSLDPKRQQTIVQFLEAANLNSLDRRKGLLYKARMSKVDLRERDLSASVLKGANLSLAKLSGIDLSNSNLKGATLRGSDLTGAKLGGIDLSNSDLTSIGLIRSDLRIANLVRSKIVEANFADADLTGANLSGADLTNAKNLTDEQLAVAKLCQTKLPRISSLDPNRDC